MESPETDVIVPLNTIGEFFCKTEINDTGLIWQIQFPNALFFSPHEYLRPQFESRGLVVTSTNTTSTFSISGLPKNNNTLVFCVIFGGETSPAVSFIVFGKK